VAVEEAVQVVVELAVAASAVADQAVVASAVEDPLHPHRHIENQ
jgi:hypothetical protein